MHSLFAINNSAHVNEDELPPDFLSRLELEEDPAFQTSHARCELDCLCM